MTVALPKVIPPALDGVTVLDLSVVGPGARATRILADYGAEVVKVGRVDGGTAPPPYAYGGGKGMRQVRFDLKDPSGLEEFLTLVGDADVVLESFRPRVADRLGIGWSEVRRVNPRIIYCSTSGYGQRGMRSNWAGHDLNYLAVAGYLATGGQGANGEPVLPGATVADIAAGGMHAAMAIMAALLRRERTGKGEYLDVGVTDGVLAMMSLYADEHLMTGVKPGPGHSVLTGRYGCYGVYQCADGGFVAVAAIEPEFWRKLCRRLGLENLIELQYDDTRQDEVRATLAECFLTKSRDDWVAELGPADCCVSAVNSVAEACADEGFRKRKLFVKAVDDEGKEFERLAPIWAGTQKRVES